MLFKVCRRHWKFIIILRNRMSMNPTSWIATTPIPSIFKQIWCYSTHTVDFTLPARERNMLFVVLFRIEKWHASLNILYSMPLSKSHIYLSSIPVHLYYCQLKELQVTHHKLQTTVSPSNISQSWSHLYCMPYLYTINKKFTIPKVHTWLDHIFM